MAQRAHVVSESRDRAIAEKSTHAHDHLASRQTLVILEVGDRRLALPISSVSRLEKITPSQIERADGREVVQYRRQIMPLLWIGELLDLPTTRTSDQQLQVVVHSEGDKSVGLVVDRIADIVDAMVESKRTSTSTGLLASAVIQQQVTDLVDLPTIIRSADPTFFEAATMAGGAA
jgi:two-component system chemotaxis sensor kinase CheA